MTPKEQQLLATFLAPYFGPDFSPADLVPEEQAILDETLSGIDQDFSGKKYILGLALDFTLLAQKLSLSDAEAKGFRPNLNADALFQRYERITERGRRLANTLTVKYGTATEGIRGIEEQVVKLFNALNRSGYPSAYVYNTGQWHKYPRLMLGCFQLSEPGRYSLCLLLVRHGLERLAENTFFGRETERPRLFPAVIADYDRSARSTENGGLVYQALAYGFIKADRSHLDIIADKVRTGSSRQRRFGDVDGYYGLDLEVSVEVKDLPVTADNLSRQFGEFVSQAAGSHINGIAFAASFTKETREELENAGITPLAQSDLEWIVRGWDWQKQDRAVQGVLHYLAHVEQNPEATNRLLAFIEGRDAAHSSLAYWVPDRASSSEGPPDSSPAGAVSPSEPD